MNYKLLLEIARQRRSTIILVVALLMLNVSLYTYLSLYQQPQIESQQTDWFKKRQSSGSLVAKDAATIYSEGTRDLKIWLTKIPPKKDFARFLGDLFGTAANNSLVVKNVTYKPEFIKEEGLLAYTIGFNVSGNYAAVKSFITDLERSREMITIDNITLLNSSTTLESIELKLQLTTYLRMEGA